MQIQNGWKCNGNDHLIWGHLSTRRIFFFFSIVQRQQNCELAFYSANFVRLSQNLVDSFIYMCCTYPPNFIMTSYSKFKLLSLPTKIWLVVGSHFYFLIGYDWWLIRVALHDPEGWDISWVWVAQAPTKL